MTSLEPRPARCLIAGIGYSFLHDWSIGPRVVRDLADREWPAGVEVDDWSFGPIDAVNKLQGAVPPYDRIVFFGAVDRGRPPGTVLVRRWDAAELPSTDDIQQCVGEAISGVISLDNMVIVCGGLGALPDDVTLIEVEPSADDSWGEGFSPEVEVGRRVLIAHIEAEAARNGGTIRLGQEASP